MKSLKNILKINAISSGLTGLMLALMPQAIGRLMGTANTIVLIAVGIFLVGFSIFVFEVSLAKPVRKQAVKVIIALDTAWVIGSALALLFLLPVLSVFGNAAIIAVALWVAAMALLQKRGLEEAVSGGQKS